MLSQSFSFLFVCGYFPGFKSLFSLLIRLTGSDSIGKELPQTHGVLHAADITHCVEYTDWKRSFISCHLCISCFLAPSNRLKSICFGAEHFLPRGLTSFWASCRQTGHLLWLVISCLFDSFSKPLIHITVAVFNVWKSPAYSAGSKPPLTYLKKHWGVTR